MSSDEDTFNKLWREYVVKSTSLILNNRMVWHINMKRQKRKTWFNLEAEELDDVCNQLDKVLKLQANNHSRTQHVFVDVYAETIRKNASQDAPKKNILLERWHIECLDAKEAPKIDSNSENPHGELQPAYRKLIVSMRSLYTYLMLLPSYKLFLKTRKNRNLVTKIAYLLSNVEPTNLSDAFEEGSSLPHKFDVVHTKYATISLSVTYRKNLSQMLHATTEEAILRKDQINTSYFDDDNSKAPDTPLNPHQTGPSNPFDNVEGRNRSRSLPQPPKVVPNNPTKPLPPSLLSKQLGASPPMRQPIAQPTGHSVSPPTAIPSRERSVSHAPAYVNVPRSVPTRHQEFYEEDMFNYDHDDDNFGKLQKQRSGTDFYSKEPLKRKNSGLGETPPFATSELTRALTSEKSTPIAIKNNDTSTGSAGSSLSSISSSGGKFSSSTSPPFKNREFKISFSPLNDSPLNSYQPPSSMLSGSFKNSSLSGSFKGVSLADRSGESVPSLLTAELHANFPPSHYEDRKNSRRGSLDSPTYDPDFVDDDAEPHMFGSMDDDRSSVNQFIQLIDRAPPRLKSTASNAQTLDNLLGELEKLHKNNLASQK